ncbi:MAG: hypothetical protein ABJC89_09430 [Acidobacteriota bacterium]
MAKATSISVSKLSSAVQDAVKAAVQTHPKLKVEPATLSLGYLIWGFPVPEHFHALTVRETQAFASDVAAGLGTSVGTALGSRLEGAVFSHGGHLIIGFPAPPEVLFEL